LGYHRHRRSTSPHQRPSSASWTSAWSNDFYWAKQESSSAYWWWTLEDMNGDGRPDLLWPTDPDGYYDPWTQNGQPRWKVFAAQ
jgi:hypothetical protein